MQMWEGEKEQGGVGLDGDCVWIKHIHNESMIVFTEIVIHTYRYLYYTLYWMGDMSIPSMEFC